MNAREIGEVDDAMEGDDQEEDGVNEADDGSGSGDRSTVDGDMAADAHDIGECVDDSVEDGDELPVVHGDDAASASLGRSRGGGRK